MRYEKPEIMEVESALAVILAEADTGQLDGASEPPNRFEDGTVLAGLDD